MTRSGRRPRAAARVLAIASAALLAGCGAGGDGVAEPRPSRQPDTQPATPTPSQAESASPSATAATPEMLDPWNFLHPGKDGTLPVRFRWANQLDAPESFYVVGDVVYVSDACLVTLSVDTGEELWRACKPDGDGIYTDGGDEIGPAGPGRIRVYTWFNETLLIDTVAHRVISRRSAGGERPPGFEPFPALVDKTYRLGWGADGHTEARDARGRLAWSIETHESWFDHLGVVRSPTGGILVTRSGLMVALDYER